MSERKSISGYYCKTSNGNYPPSFIHHSIESAISEARRLKEQHKCTSVEVLKIVAVIEDRHVPVTRLETTVTFEDGYSTDDLPF